MNEHGDNANIEANIIAASYFKLTQEVRVKRSSGEIEEGWLVIAPDNFGKIIVARQVGNDIKKKSVQASELLEWNPELKK